MRQLCDDAPTRTKTRYCAASRLFPNSTMNRITNPRADDTAQGGIDPEPADCAVGRAAPCRDLECLSPYWSEGDEREFSAAIAPLAMIDEALWQ